MRNTILKGRQSLLTVYRNNLFQSGTWQNRHKICDWIKKHLPLKGLKKFLHTKLWDKEKFMLFF